MIIVGICLEIAAACIGTFSKQLIAISDHLESRWIFILGAGLNVAVGPVVDASAYAFAPAVVIAPFACLDVILNAVTAPFTLSWQEEKLTRAHLIATVLVATGACCTSIFGSVREGMRTMEEIEAKLTHEGAVVYYLVEIGFILLVNASLRARLLPPKVRGITLGVIAGLLVGNVFAMKGFICIVRLAIAEGTFQPFLRITPWALAVVAGLGAVGGNYYMREGLREYKGVFMVTIFEGSHICTACLSGCIVMQEMAHAPWYQYLLYWCSVMTIIVGMLIINTAAVDAALGVSCRHFNIAQLFLGDENELQMPTGRILFTESYAMPEDIAGAASPVPVSMPLIFASTSSSGFHKPERTSDTEMDGELDSLMKGYHHMMARDTKEQPMQAQAAGVIQNDPNPTSNVNNHWPPRSAT